MMPTSPDENASDSPSERSEKAQRFVTYRGEHYALVGELPQVDCPAPDFTVYAWLDARRISITLADFLAEKKPLLLSVFASHDTPVSRLQAKIIDNKLGSFGGAALGVHISSDLPFTINRAFQNEQLTSTVGVSDYYDRNFGRAYGVLLDDSAVLARAIFVIDGDGILRHVQVPKNISSEPNYDLAIKIVGWLIDRSSRTEEEAAGDSGDDPGHLTEEAVSRGGPDPSDN